ncbi:hypothetical protein BJX99DRAFT_261141 [Aspergillus californicus]
MKYSLLASILLSAVAVTALPAGTVNTDATVEASNRPLGPNGWIEAKRDAQGTVEDHNRPFGSSGWIGSKRDAQGTVEDHNRPFGSSGWIGSKRDV